MGFLYPVFLLGALAIAVPIVLHFLRRDVAPEVPFSAVRLLPRSPIARSRRRRLRDLLLLAARVAALLLLAAAFARPYLSDTAAAASSVRLVAIDRSFSMGAPGRFARALELARQAVDEAGPGERVAVLTFDDAADLVAGPGTAADARAALAGLETGFGGTRYGPLFAKAVEVADGAAGRLVVITDLQRAGWEDGQRAVLPSTLQVLLKDTGAPPANLAVSAVRVEKDRIVASIRNSAREGRSGPIRVVRDGRTVAAATYQAIAASVADVPIAYRTPGSGSIAISIDDPGGFAADDTRYAVLDPVVDQSALVVTSGTGESGFYLSRALAVAPGEAPGEAIAARLAAAGALSAMTGADLARQSAIVLLSTRGLERRARESVAQFVRAGGGLLIAASPDVEPVVLSTIFDWRPALRADLEDASPSALSATDLRHPIFRPFGALAANLGQIRFQRAWRLRGEGWDVAARFTDGTPALLERREGQGRVVLFASDVDRRWNDFPLHPAFVPFAVEAVRYVSGDQDRARDYTVARVPPGAQARPGIYRAQSDGRAIAVNVDPRESATTRVTPDDFERMLDRVSAGERASADPRAPQIEARQSYWQYGLLLMLGALVAESFVGRP
jgi:hypothetical protein